MVDYLTREEIEKYRDKLRDDFLRLFSEYQKLKKETFAIAKEYIKISFYLDPVWLDKTSEELKIAKKYFHKIIINEVRLSERILELLYAREKKLVSGISSAGN